MTDSRRPVPSKQSRPNRPVPQPPSAPVKERWVDLREAEELTGIPASTIRNWARKHRIDSRFEMDESGDRRYVEITEVVAWADHLGRQHKPLRERAVPVLEPQDSGEIAVATEPRDTPAPSPAPDGRSPGERPAAPDTTGTAGAPAGAGVPTRSEQPAAPDAGSAGESQSAAHQPDIPEGTMLVPLDAWNKMLNQLGNLHEAGQQLAEARERAAKAETEVQFLRERLAEMRNRTEPDGAAPAAAESAVVEEEQIEPLWVDLYRRWKRRR